MLSLQENCRHIWRKCFGDTEAFMDLYFSRRFSEECTFVVRVGEEVVAQSQCFLYQVTSKEADKPLLVGYISGLATLSQYRNKGYAHQLVCQMHEWLRSKGASYCTLIASSPQTEAWYSKHFGYRRGIKNQKKVMPTDVLSHYTKATHLSDSTLAFVVDHLCRRACYFQHTPGDLIDQAEVCLMSGGGVYERYSSDGKTLQEVLFVEYHADTPILLDAFPYADSLRMLHDVPCQQGLYVPICADKDTPLVASLSLMLD